MLSHFGNFLAAFLQIYLVLRRSGTNFNISGFLITVQILIFNNNFMNNPTIINIVNSDNSNIAYTNIAKAWQSLHTKP